jgi:hypothetical protein
MRVRLLIDVTLEESEVSSLADLIADQPPATVRIEGFRELGARFMGATPVHHDDPGEMH